MTDPRPNASLVHDLETLSPALRERLGRVGFDAERLLSLAGGLTGDPTERRDKRNRVAGSVEGPRPGEVVDAPAAGTPEHARLAAVGRAALERGEVAFVVMAGGMATRMGGVVKALVEVLEGKSFLELRLRENAALERLAGRPVPLWLMTSEATDEPLRGALARLEAPAHVRTFVQGLSLRLTADGALFRDGRGEPSAYATGHGDLVDALRRSGLLEPFRANGGKAVWITNVDNLGATVDTAILGAYLEAGTTLQVEVCDKVPGDKGGIPVHAEGWFQVLEEFRLPRGFDASKVGVFNTNTFLVEAEALARTPFTWSWCEVEKKVDGKTAVQFERLLQELTHGLAARYIRVPREGDAARFLPVKDVDELARRRPEIEAVVRSRGIL